MPNQATNAISNPALEDEIGAVNAIYGTDVLTVVAADTSDRVNNSVATNDNDVIEFVLQLPIEPSISFLLSCNHDYPSSPPRVNGTQSTGHLGKGQGHEAAKILAETLARIWTPGAACLFDLVEEVRPLLEAGLLWDGEAERNGAIGEADAQKAEARRFDGLDPSSQNATSTVLTKQIAADMDVKPVTAELEWSVSESVTEKKSVFVARCASISQKTEVTASLSQLSSRNRKIASATHNITAWRIRDERSGIVTQDCDDDGETAAGGRLLHLMQLMDVWNVIVVVSRCYGGVKLGPDRFRLINQVARDALVKGSFVKKNEDHRSGKKSGKK